MNYDEYLQTLSNFGVGNQMAQQARQVLSQKREEDVSGLALSAGGVEKLYNQGRKYFGNISDYWKAFESEGVEGILKKGVEKLGGEAGKELLQKGTKLATSVKEGGIEKGMEQAKDILSSQAKSAMKTVGDLVDKERENLGALQSEFIETRRKFTKARKAGDTELAERLKVKGAELRDKVGELMGRDKKEVEGALDRNIYGKELRDTINRSKLPKVSQEITEPLKELAIEKPKEFFWAGSEKSISSSELGEKLRQRAFDMDPETQSNLISIEPREIQSGVSANIEAGKAAVTEGLEAGKAAVTEGLEAGKAAVTGTVEELKTEGSAALESAKETATNALEGAKAAGKEAIQGVSEGVFNAAKGAAEETVGALGAIPIVGEIADVALAGYSLFDLIKNRSASTTQTPTISSIGASYTPGQI
jgi:hypothetical protein